jgi:60 kDa SS-A/Ro ribonucleoprotein
MTSYSFNVFETQLGYTQQGDENNNFTHTISTKDYITRILILGCKTNKYSSNTKGLDEEAKEFIKKQITNGNGNQVLDIVRDIYISGRAPKQDMTIYVHALLCRSEDNVLRAAALRFLKEYRTISQIYSWKNIHSKIPNADGKITKGFGRAVKRNLNEWILSKTPDALAYQATKYMSRGEWGIVDLMKCIHTKTGTGDNRVFKDKDGNVIENKNKCEGVCESNKNHVPAKPIDLVLRYIIEGVEPMNELAFEYDLTNEPVYKYLKAIDHAKTMTNFDKTKKANLLIKIIQKFNLTREQVPTEALSNPMVMAALLTDENRTKITMPMTALLRNLANITRIGVFEENPDILELVIQHMQNKEVISKSRIHPVNVLTAWFTYRQGHGKMSKHSWIPNERINAVLEEIFYLSFKNVKPTGKRICFLIDGSGSMSSESLCDGITNAEAAALMAMVFSRAEANSDKPVQHSFYIFTAERKGGYGGYGGGSTGLTDVSDKIHAKSTFNDVFTATQRSDWGMTDISKGITEAAKYNHVYDGFVVLTDNDVNSGIKPSVALQQYRTKMKLPTKLAVVATLMSDLSVADPKDKGMMDFCGFDSHCPKLLQEFFTDIATNEQLETETD